MAALLCGILFVSGAAAVAFQTLWFRQAGLILGNTVWASSIVLASFMAGLALGNAASAALGDRLRRPLVAFAALETTIGLTGLAVVAGSFELPGLLAPWLRSFVETPWLLNGLRLGLAFALLFAPATAMGMTLPVVVRVLFERQPSYGVVLGRLYGWNTLGATLGAVAPDAFLVGHVGVVGAAAVAAGCNAIAASGALALHHRIGRKSILENRAQGGAATLSETDTRSRRRTTALLASGFLAGGIFLALEVVWFRFLTLFVHSDTLAFSMLLAVVLAGIGCGGVLASVWLARDPSAPRFAPALACACGALCVATYAGFRLALGPFGAGYLTDAPDVLALAAALMLPNALATGALFPLLGAAAKGASDSPARAAGRFVLANTLGSALGPLIGAFVLLPLLGMERSLWLLAGTYVGVAALAAVGLAAGTRSPGSLRSTPQRVVTAGAVVALGAALGAFPSGLMDRVYLRVPVLRIAPDGKEAVVAVREGVTETLLYLRRDHLGEPYAFRLVTNGFSMSGTSWLGRRYMKLFVWLPVALRPEPKHALLISYGVGSTAKALVDTPSLETIDVVEVSRDVLELSSVVWASPDDDPLHDPRVRVHLEDGRFFLQVTDQRFDLITGEPPPPKMAGIAYLYTQEYFQLVHDRLTEDGIATYWLPVHSLYESDAKRIVAAFCAAFADCSLWNGADRDWILVGSRRAPGAVAETTPSEEAFTRQWRDPRISAELRATGVEVPEQLGALFLADADRLHALTADTRPLSDRWPLWDQAGAPLGQDAGAAYRAWLDPERNRTAFDESAFVRAAWPARLRAATRRSFDFQRWIDTTFPGLGGAPLPLEERMDAIRELLLETELETLPLWLLGIDADQERIARGLQQAGRTDALVKRDVALGLLARRQYVDAARRFRSVPPAGVPSYEALAFALAGRTDEARAVLAQVDGKRAPEPGEREYWRWLARRFALPDPYESPARHAH